ncbi:EndoU domain-containing protein, partial [Streptomyces sp. NPDC002491]
AARSAVVRLREVLHAAYPPPGHSAELVDGSFFTADPTSAGQTAFDPELDNSEALDRLIAGGSVRELMTAFFNAAGKKALYEGDPEVPSLTSVLRSVLDLAGGPGSGDGMRLAGRLGLDRAALESYARFLHGGARDALEKGIEADPDLHGQAYLFGLSDPFALGSLAAHGPTDADKDPWEIVRSQLARVARPVGEREIGPSKKSPRDYTYLGARLTDGERTFLSRHARPLSLVGFEIEEIPLDTLTFDQAGEPDVTGILSRPNVSTVEIQRAPAPAEHGPGAPAAQPRPVVERVFAVVRTPVVVEALRAGDLRDDANRREPNEQGPDERQSDERQSDEQGPELPLSWVEGIAYWTLDEQSPWYRRWHAGQGMPLVAGVSGTTLRMLRAFQWLNVRDTSAVDFRKALMGWMLPGQDHSLFEIVRASHLADVGSPEEEAALNEGVTGLYAIPGVVPAGLAPPGPAVPTGSGDVRPAVNMDMVDPLDHRHLSTVEGEQVWRFSGEDPETVFRDGFHSDGPDEHLRLYMWAMTTTARAPFVSTTRNFDLWFRHKRYRYEIDSARNSDPVGINLDMTILRQKAGRVLPRGWRNTYAEQEITFTGSIEPAAVVSVYDSVQDRTGVRNAETGEVDWHQGQQQVPRRARLRLSDGATGTPGTGTPGTGTPGTGTPGTGTAATDGPLTLLGSGEVNADRWLPFGSRSGRGAAEGPEAFVLTPDQDGGRPRVERMTGTPSGERTRVGYSWAHYRGATPAQDVLRLTRRVHLVARDVSPGRLAAVRDGLRTALEELVNGRGYRVPVVQPDRVTGPSLPGPLLRVEVRFVDSAAEADSVVTVHDGLPGRARAMVQNAWYSGVHPAAYVHEVVHGLGVIDDAADARVLLTPGGRGVQTLAEGESSLMDAFTDPARQNFVLTTDHLQQIADVLTPYFHHTPTPTDSESDADADPYPDPDVTPAVTYSDGSPDVTGPSPGGARSAATAAVPARLASGETDLPTGGQEQDVDTDTDVPPGAITGVEIRPRPRHRLVVNAQGTPEWEEVPFQWVGGRGAGGALSIRAFEARRRRLPSGEHSSRAVVRVALRPAEGAQLTQEALAELRQRAWQGVAAVWNTGHRLPNGDLFGVDLQFVDDENAAHHTVTVHAELSRDNHRNWGLGTEPVVLAHEVGHLLGLEDEYREYGDNRRRTVYEDEGLMGPMGRDERGRPLVDNDHLAPGNRTRTRIPPRNLRQIGAWMEAALRTADRRTEHEAAFFTEDALNPRADGLPTRAHFSPEVRRSLLYGDVAGAGGGHVTPPPASDRPRPDALEEARPNGTYRAAYPHPPRAAAEREILSHPVAGDLTLPVRQDGGLMMFPAYWTEEDAVYAAEQAYLDALRASAVRPVLGRSGVHAWVGEYAGVRIEGELSRGVFTGFRPSDEQPDTPAPAYAAPPAPTLRAHGGPVFGRRVEDLVRYGDRRSRTGAHHEPRLSSRDQNTFHGLAVRRGETHHNDTYDAQVSFLHPGLPVGAHREVRYPLWRRHADEGRHVMFPQAWEPGDLLTHVERAHASAQEARTVRQVDDRGTYHWVGTAEGVRIEGLVRDGRHLAFRPTYVQPHAGWPGSRPIGESEAAPTTVESGGRRLPLDVRHLLFANGQRAVELTVRVHLDLAPGVDPVWAGKSFAQLREAVPAAMLDAVAVSRVDGVPVRLSLARTVDRAQSHHTLPVAGRDLRRMIDGIRDLLPERQDLTGFVTSLVEGGAPPARSWQLPYGADPDSGSGVLGRALDRLALADPFGGPTTLREADPADRGDWLADPMSHAPSSPPADFDMPDDAQSDDPPLPLLPGATIDGGVPTAPDFSDGEGGHDTAAPQAGNSSSRQSSAPTAPNASSVPTAPSDALPAEAAGADERAAERDLARVRLESQLGAHYHSDAAALHAARAAVQRLRDVLRAAYPHYSPQFVDAAFLSTDPTAHGQVGNPPASPGEEYYSSKEWLDTLLEDGTVGETMTAFFNAVGKKTRYERNDVIPSMTHVLERVLGSWSAHGDGDPSRAVSTHAEDLGLDGESLAAYAKFLHGEHREALRQAVLDDSEIRGQVGLFDRAPFALGNLAAFNPAGIRKDPLEVARSLQARVPRPEAGTPGPTAMTPRDYQYLGVPLTSRELDFLWSHERPLTVVGFDVRDIPLRTLEFDPVSGDPLVDHLLAEPDVVRVETRRRPSAPGTPRGPVESVFAVVRTVKEARHLRAADLVSEEEQGPEFPLGWISGLARYGLDEGSPWYRERHVDGGMPLVCGVSGTTLRMMRDFQWLRVRDADAFDFRKALLGWMLPGRDHSLYEVMRASHLADVSTPQEASALEGNAEDLYAVPGLLPDHLTPPGGEGGADTAPADSADVAERLSESVDQAAWERYLADSEQSDEDWWFTEPDSSEEEPSDEESKDDESDDESTDEESKGEESKGDEPERDARRTARVSFVSTASDDLLEEDEAPGPGEDEAPGPEDEDGEERPGAGEVDGRPDPAGRDAAAGARAPGPSRIETQLDTHRPPRVDRTMPAPSAEDGPVVFTDGSRLP